MHSYCILKCFLNLFLLVQLRALEVIRMALEADARAETVDKATGAATQPVATQQRFQQCLAVWKCLCFSVLQDILKASYA